MSHTTMLRKWYDILCSELGGGQILRIIFKPERALQIFYVNNICYAVVIKVILFLASAKHAEH